MSVPHLFRCPICLDIFTDPVTLCTGQTYDRPCIERWLAAGHRACPVTMQRLGDAALVPNHTLRHLIERWLSSGPDHHRPEAPAHEPTTAAATTGAELSLAALKQCLQADAPADGAKAGVLKKVITLSSESDVGRACLIQLGFFPVLLQLLFQSPMPLECHSEVKELALECALSLLLPSNATQLDNLNMLKRDSNMACFVLLLEHGNGKVRASLCHLLETIATALATRDLVLTIAKSPRVWQALVLLLRDKADVRASEAAVHAVTAMCAIEPNRVNAIREGAIGALVQHLSTASGKGSAVSKALATLELLLASEAGKKAVAGTSNAVQVVVRHVFMMSSSNDGSEHAVAALLAVCQESRVARSEAVAAGVVTQLLLLLQSQCSSRAKAKARALLKLLRSM